MRSERITLATSTTDTKAGLLAFRANWRPRENITSTIFQSVVFLFLRDPCFRYFVHLQSFPKATSLSAAYRYQLAISFLTKGVTGKISL